MRRTTLSSIAFSWRRVLVSFGGRWAAITVVIVLTLGSAAGQAQNESSGFVQIVDFPLRQGYPDAAAPGAIRLACTAVPELLPGFFKQRGLPFDRELVSAVNPFPACHIYYEPTLPGFRASRDDSPIQALYVAVDPLNFFADAEYGGSSLDIARTVLGRLPRAIDLRVSVAGGFAKEQWDAATRYHFDGMPHRLELFDSGMIQAHPWTQDHLKGGSVAGEKRVLMPRHLFEGKPSDGELYESLLQHLEADHVVRSKLSWEGGDLQFVASPKDPTRTILAHGAAERNYWGLDLTPQEYSYVLKTEFGADEVLDLSRLGPHADYLVAFLPAAGVALLSQLVRGNADIARSAAFELAESFSSTVPVEIRRLAAIAAEWDPTAKTGKKEFLQAIASARTAIAAVEEDADPETDIQLNDYIAKNCPQKPVDCFDSAGTSRMLVTDRELLRKASSRRAAEAINADLRPILLDLIEAQVSPPAWKDAALNDAAKQLAAWGFRVVRVPLLATKSFHRGWPGVSYVNLLSFDRRLFVPTLGLGRAEDRIITKLRRDLNGEYDIVPVNARASLLKHGSVHCVFGIIRAP